VKLSQGSLVLDLHAAAHVAGLAVLPNVAGLLENVKVVKGEKR